MDPYKTKCDGHEEQSACEQHSDGGWNQESRSIPVVIWDTEGRGMDAQGQKKLIKCYWQDPDNVAQSRKKLC